MMLPKLTPDLQRIFLWGIADQIPEHLPPVELMFQISTLHLDLSLKLDRVISHILICDMEHMTFPYAAYTMAVLKKMLIFSLVSAH